ncbi:hypothetical protein CEXT_66851 [Caerostris extrusa]|uniref:Uncharacterized protein n=1 Tax=Caerostris extrusa TaxID=172846 RepID=A0AAV4P3S5_CAEEX|nr:hypothetical protein CEXT_66851 [Caerostris extrusa]
MQYTVIRVRLSLFSPSEYLLHPIRPEAAGEIDEVFILPSASNNTQGGKSFVHPRNRVVNAAFPDSRGDKISNSRNKN